MGWWLSPHAVEPDPVNASERTYGTAVTTLGTLWPAKRGNYINPTMKPVIQISPAIQNLSLSGIMITTLELVWMRLKIVALVEKTKSSMLRILMPFPIATPNKHCKRKSLLWESPGFAF